MHDVLKQLSFQKYRFKGVGLHVFLGGGFLNPFFPTVETAGSRMT